MTKTKSQITHINRTLFKFMGGCLHENIIHSPVTSVDIVESWMCHGCRKIWVKESDFELPNFYSDLNLLREVELKIKDEGLEFEYVAILWRILTGQPADSWHLDYTFGFIVAPANIRAEALCEVIETIGGK